MTLSPKSKSRTSTISPPGRDAQEHLHHGKGSTSSSKSPIATSTTAGFVTLGTPAAAVDASFLQVYNSSGAGWIPDHSESEALGGLLDFEVGLDSQVAAWTTSATTTGAEYSKAMAAWYQQDRVVQGYAWAATKGRGAGAAWEEMKLNTFLLKDQLDEQWKPGSPLFDVEASFGAMGAPLGTGLYFRRLFWNPKLQIVHAPLLFLRQFPGQQFAEFPMICGCLDDVLAFAGLESVGAFTAWLSVSPPLVPVPVNSTLLAKISLREAPVESGKKPSKAKKMMISVELVRPLQEEEEEELVYVRAEGLFVRPATGGLDLRRYVMHGPMSPSSQVIWGAGQVREQAETILAEKLQEAGEQGPGGLEAVKHQRAGFLSQLQDETSGEGILVRVPNAEVLEAHWIKTHPIFRQLPELLTAPADPLPTGQKYLTGGALLRFSNQHSQKKTVAGLGDQEEGSLCVVGAVHFLPPVEGPPGLVHGGCIYGVFENLFGQALAALKTNPEEQQQEQLVLKVQYKGQLPLNDTYRLDCCVCKTEGPESEAGAGAGASMMLRGTLRSLDGQTVYNEAEARLPESLRPKQQWPGSHGSTAESPVIQVLAQFLALELPHSRL